MEEEGQAGQQRLRKEERWRGKSTALGLLRTKPLCSGTRLVLQTPRRVRRCRASWGDRRQRVKEESQETYAWERGGGSGWKGKKFRKEKRVQNQKFMTWTKIFLTN